MSKKNIKSEGDRIQEALNLAASYGQIDGGHHKLWVIDQMVQALLGSKKEYKLWVAEYEEEDEFGDKEYEWETGIAP